METFVNRYLFCILILLTRHLNVLMILIKYVGLSRQTLMPCVSNQKFVSHLSTFMLLFFIFLKKNHFKMCSVCVFVCTCAREHTCVCTRMGVPVYRCKYHIWEEARRAARPSGIVVAGGCEPPHVRTRLWSAGKAMWSLTSSRVSSHVFSLISSCAD